MPRTRKSSAIPLDRDTILAQINEGIKRQAVRPNLYAYTPHGKQRIFHMSIKHTKLYIGGNRSGKTTGGVVEDIFWAMGRHPFRKVPDVPTRGRVVAVDLVQGIEKTILPEFGRWLPPSFLINGSWEDSYNKQLRTLELTNNSFIEFMSYEMDLEKFSGTSRHWTHYDEEPPKHIYNECQARLIDMDGSSWITMTPLMGMTWVFDDIYNPGKEGTDPDIEVVIVDMADNPYVSEVARLRYLKTLDKDERAAREHGQFIQLGGLVFKQFNRATHVISPVIPPKDWEWYCSIDHGYNNPTAMLWHAVSRDDQVVTFSEHYQSEMTIAEHSEVFHKRNEDFGRVPDIVCGDPSMHQRSPITGTSLIQEYADHGIYISTEGIPKDVQVGVNRINQYLRLDAKNQSHWHITENCDALINEIERLRWKTWATRKASFENNKHEVIHKKDDHACDSARYFFTLLPDLGPFDIESPSVDFQTALRTVVGDATVAAPVSGSWDEILSQRVKAGEVGPWKITQYSDLSGLEYD